MNSYLSAWFVLSVLVFMVGCADSRPPSLRSRETATTGVQNNDIVNTLITPTADPEFTPLIISEVDKSQNEAEVLVIKNISNYDQNIAGMALLNLETSEYIVLPDVTLRPGETFKIYNGAINEGISGGIKWLEEPTLRLTGDTVVLLNQAGRALWYYTNP